VLLNNDKKRYFTRLQFHREDARHYPFLLLFQGASGCRHAQRHMLNPHLRFKQTGKSLNVAGFSAHGDYFKAIMVVKVDVL
jgi:hypothetical protein